MTNLPPEIRRLPEAYELSHAIHDANLSLLRDCIDAITAAHDQQLKGAHGFSALDKALTRIFDAMKQKIETRKASIDAYARIDSEGQ
jgi:hypothetical protein